MQLLTFLQAEMILMLTESTSVSIALSQVVHGRVQGLREGQSDCPIIDGDPVYGVHVSQAQRSRVVSLE